MSNSAIRKSVLYFKERHLIAYRLKITAKAIYDELISRGVDVSILHDSGLLKFNVNGANRYVQSSLTDRSSSVGVNISGTKSITADIATSVGMKHPAFMIYDGTESAHDFLNKYGTIVIKPNDGAHGNGVTTSVTRSEQLDDAVNKALAKSQSKKVILQEQIFGQDVRVLLIEGKLAASSIRMPAAVKGDGKNTVADLIAIENRSSLRGENYYTSLNSIDTHAAANYVGDKFDTMIPEQDKMIQVAGTANIGTGGTAVDVTDLLPNEIYEQSLALMEELSLECSGVDFMASDISDASTYYFIEINASPSFGLHMKPTRGTGHQVQKQFVDMLLRSHSTEARNHKS